MKSVVRNTAYVLLLCGLGCAPQGRPYDPSKPIDRTHGLRQDGELVNAKEVETGLLREEKAGRYMRRAKTWYTVSLVAAFTGGALIGWPLGQELANNPDPSWELAAVGGGVLAFSFALVPVVVANSKRAIDAHNELVGPPQMSFADGKFHLEANARGLALRF